MKTSASTFSSHRIRSCPNSSTVPPFDAEQKDSANKFLAGIVEPNKLFLKQHTSKNLI